MIEVKTIPQGEKDVTDEHPADHGPIKSPKQAGGKIGYAGKEGAGGRKRGRPDWG